MCNLYKIRSSHTEIADFFDAIAGEFQRNTAEEVYPGYPAPVVAGGEVVPMVWGFPLQRKGANGQPLKPKPVNNTRTDKLDSFFWRYSFEQRRCLVPVTEFAEAEGPKGGKTRTWLSLPGQEMFAIAGIWRESEEWGRCYSMMMTDANEAVLPMHDRMPVVLRREDWAQWIAGSPQEARALCVPYPGEMAVDRTDQPWVARR